MFGCNPIYTPLVVNEKLKKEDGGKKVDGGNYRGLVGNLFYLTSTRPDIIFAVSLLSRFMNYPSHIRLGLAKKASRYIQCTLDYAIKYDSKV